MEPHLEPGKCPGQIFFERKEKEQGDEIRKVIKEVLGDVPEHYKKISGNRMWLVWLSAGFVVIGALIIAHLT